MTSILTDEEAYVNRNSKENHDQKLQDFKTCHDKVREQAMCALKLFELKIEADQAKQRADDAQRILAVKTAKAQHEIRLREAENAAKLVPKPPPRVPTPPPQSLPQVPVQRPAPTPTPPTDHTIAAPSVVSPQPPTQLAKPRQPQQQVQQPQPVQPPQQPPKQPQQPPPQSVQHPILNANQPQPAQTSTRPPRPVQDPPFGQHTISTVPPPLVEELSKRDNVDPSIAALEAIHKTCKDMRKYIKSQPRDFVKHAGDMRRKIKMHMGQLVEVGSNKHQADAIKGVLLGALTHPSEGHDPRLFMMARPEPDSTAKNNGETMPLLFIYLMNIFAKAIIAQLISEASAKPAAAEPIGVIAHQIFSQPEFLWRNVSFIDILIAKYRFSCPILFGITGNEKTEGGRAQIGWKNDSGNWVSPQEHSERMIGLGAGYAALTLRNYSKTVTRKNPYAPHHYWQAIAMIVNTDPDKVCQTQFTVLKALIEDHWEKFVAFYGNMAMGALRAAVVSFPACAKETSVSVKALQVLAQKWQNEFGFYLH